MTAATNDRRLFWMSIGLAAGLAVGYVWPHEHAAAAMADRSDKFVMLTAPLDALDAVEGVFVLDFLTGQLRGAALNNSTGTFSLGYVHNVAADFNVNPNAQATYAMVAGKGNLPSRGNNRPATSCLYIAELNSGRVVCYSFPFQQVNRPVPAPLPLVKIDGFQFREAVAP